MARRIAMTTLLGVVVLLVGALPASAAVRATVTSPASGQDITGSVPVRVCVTRDSLFESYPSSVEVRLSRDGSSIASGSSVASVPSTGQDCSGGRLYAGIPFDPRSPDEFGLSGPLANGTWYVQGRAGGQDWSGSGFTVSVPPSPVTGLTARADLRDVTLSWTRAPEPDISSYRVQRRPEGGGWQMLPSTGSTATSYEDTTPSAGTYEYRVVTVRPDGHGSVLTATSSSTSVRTSDPEPTPSRSTGGSSGGTSGGGSSDGGDGSDTTTGGSEQDGDGGDEGTADGGSDGSSSDGTDADGTAEDGEGAVDGDGDQDGGSTSTRRSSGRRIAAPPGVRQGASLDLDAELPNPEVAPRSDEERFYGEGEGFSEELDYGDADAVAAGGGDDDGRNVLQRIPGGIQDLFISRFETRTLLRSIAAGLLFVALGLHAYRWMHAAPND